MMDEKPRDAALHSRAVAAFVGLLVALALFLLAYRGYKNKYQLVDRLAAAPSSSGTTEAPPARAR
jgi:hypothetical protein